MQAISFGQKPTRVYPIAQERQSRRGYTDEQLKQRREMFNTLRRTVAYANLSDRQLLTIARLDANRDDKYKFNTYAAALVGIPIADTFIKGTFSQAPKLSGKLKTMGKVGGAWIGAFALAGLYNGLVDKVTAVAPVLKKSEERHPVISTLLRLAGFAAVLVGAQKGISKLATVMPKKFPGVTADYQKLSTRIANAIDNSKITTKYLQPLKNKIVEKAAKHPKATSFTMATLALAVPFWMAGTVFKIFTDKVEKSNKIKDNFTKLAIAREGNRQILAQMASGKTVDAFNDWTASQVDPSDRASVAVGNPIDVVA